ncbi:hypothetical protein CDD81_184 [Ophiocordyceps australis]|uniref:Uncharacterized protein n=1 Tax=Ophiocordyceps australis TaxID=1399860 RepID=A0A2C5YGV2_9HYPO|nr:hypothetical protein CDD81_184 [Ophiocordyceps australis]
MGGSGCQDPFEWDVGAVADALCSLERPCAQDLIAFRAKLHEHEVDGFTLLTFEYVCSRPELFETLGIRLGCYKAALGYAILQLRAKSPQFRRWKIAALSELDESNGPLVDAPPTDMVNGLGQRMPPGPESVGEQHPLPRNKRKHEAMETGSKTPGAQDQDALQNKRRQRDTEMGQHRFDTPTPSAPAMSPVPTVQTSRHNAPAEAGGSVLSPQTNQNTEKGLKRKRVAPLQLSDSVGHLSSFESDFEVPALRLEANTPRRSLSDQDGTFPWEKPMPYSYLGAGILSTSAVRSPHGALNTQVCERAVGDGNFYIKFPSISPPGLRIVINRVMQRHLIKNSNREDLLRQGLVPTRTNTPDEDESIDIFDLPDEWDEETLRAIEQDRMEEQEEMEGCVPKERVQALLQEATDAFKTTWEETKLPKHQRKAYKMWTSAQRQGTRSHQILTARFRAKECDRRLKNQQSEILGQRWEREAEVTCQAMIMEQNLSDKLYHQWLAEMLESRTEPLGPASLPKPKERPTVRRPVLKDTEVLSSSDDDDFIVDDEPEEPVQDDGPLHMDHNMEEDVGGHVHPVEDGGVASRVEMMDPRDETPEWPDSHSIVDLTGLDSSPEPSPRRGRDSLVIDLTTPNRSRDGRPPPLETRLNTPDFEQAPLQEPQDEPQGVPQEMPNQVAQKEEISQEVPQEVLNKIIQQVSQEILQDTPQEVSGEAPGDPPKKAPSSLWDVAEIGRYSPKHWAKAKDGPRLVISLLWRMGHIRRAPIFDSARESSADELFLTTIESHLADPVTDNYALAVDMIWIFLAYIKAQNCARERILNISSKRAKLLRRSGEQWQEFYDFLNDIAVEFPLDSQIFRSDSLGELDDFDDEMDDDEALSDSQAHGTQTRKNAPREIVRNREALDLRERERRRLEEQEARRAKLRATLDAHGIMSQDESRLIINEAKQDDQAFVYVNREAGERIKDHQIDGVRFLWNQSILVDASMRQGCLLSHTMGLGKTMQVITFLVAVQECAQSSDPAVRSQIAEDLRLSKTLVICPAGLVDNWLDEFLIWVPEASQLLGPIRKISADMRPEERLQIINAWAEEGGVLIIGYNLFKKLAAEDGDVEKPVLLNTPNIVIADEAHLLKSPKTAVHQVSSRFRTNCRIALTGSPLANNVKEYFSMINWVAPMYLGEYSEFRGIYENPIHTGFWSDSTRAQKRKALTMLRVLSETVAPKVHRRTIQCLRSDLPPKQEFILFVPLGELQCSLYNLYIEGIDAGKTQHLTALENLRLLCNHPRCFREKAAQDRKTRQNFPEDEASAQSLIPENIISTILKLTKTADIDNANLSIKAQLLVMILDEARLAHDKVLVFSQSIPTLDYLSNLLHMQRRRVCRLDGSTTIRKRQEMVKNFNEGDQEVYLISTTAGGVGLNIQGANRVVIYDFGWNPVHDQQAVGRAYRLGQEKPVFVYRFVVVGTFEEHLNNKAVYKMQLAARVVDKKNPISFSKKHLSDLLQVPVPKPAEPLDEFVGRDHILDKLIKFKSNGEAIRWIVSTDTFEEEDPTDKLTAEERRDAEELAKLNRLRLVDPAEYGRRLEEDRAKQLMLRLYNAVDEAMPNDGFGQTVAPVQPVLAAMPQMSRVVVPTYHAPQDAAFQDGRALGFNPPQYPTFNLPQDPTFHQLQDAAFHQPHGPAFHQPRGLAFHHARAPALHPPQAPMVAPTETAPTMRAPLADASLVSPLVATTDAMPVTDANATEIPAPAEPGHVPGPDSSIIPAAEAPAVPQPDEANTTAPVTAVAVEIEDPRDKAQSTCTPAVAPVPVMGTNTYFGERNEAEQEPSIPKPSTPMPSTPKPSHSVMSNGSPVKNLFFPCRDSGRRQFEEMLLDKLKELQEDGVSGVVGDRDCIVKIAEEIENCRKGKEFGFIPDMAQWRMLREFSKNKTFALATVSAHFSPSFLALGQREDFEKRLSALEQSSNGQMQIELASGTRMKDPGNLRNLGRSPGTQGSPRAKEDERVMREAAERRRQRFAQHAATSIPWTKDTVSDGNGTAFGENK